MFSICGHSWSRSSSKRKITEAFGPPTEEDNLRRAKSKAGLLRRVHGARPGQRVLPNGAVVLLSNGVLGQTFPVGRRTGSELQLTRSLGNSKTAAEVAKKEDFRHTVSSPVDHLTRSRTVTAGYGRRRRREDGLLTKKISSAFERTTPAPAAPDHQMEANDLTKEELFLMWKASEWELNSRLSEAIRQKTEMKRKLDALTTTTMASE